MSEYQYYEFAAIERPLTEAEMARLRKVSTRGQISASGFVNHYEWGDLKADPADWMRRYFDAFVYTANWCSCRLALRVPLATFGEADLKPFAAGDALTIEASDEHWIVDWSLDESEDDDRFGAEDGSGWMGRLAPLREELLHGDLRPLYLGWLASAAGFDDDTLEPQPPAGLSDLTPAQRALAEFIEVDADLLAAAAAASPRAAADDSAQAAAVDACLAGWSREEMSAMLKLTALGQGREAGRQIRHRYAAWLKAQRPMSATTVARRSVAQLRELAQSASVVRRAHQAQERAKQETERRRQREATLRRLMTDVDQRWATVDALASRGSASGYEQAVEVLTDLAEGYALTSSRKDFDRALRSLLARHAKRGALLRRLTKAGLWSA
jgi:hypothetical protein